MSLVEIYQCLCDETRLRILNLLSDGELCVCHIQDILKEPQVKISKHLAYLRSRGLVEVRRDANWMIYGLPEKRSKELSVNLACLQDCCAEYPQFKKDSAAKTKLMTKITGENSACCAPSLKSKPTKLARS